MDGIVSTHFKRRSAEIFLNDKSLGTLIGPVYQLCSLEEILQRKLHGAKNRKPYKWIV
jgi:hypothetical protein